MTSFINQIDCQLEDVAPGLKRQILGYLNQLMLVKVYFDAQTAAPVHRHKHEQVTHVLEGKFKITIDDSEQILSTGDSFTVASDIPHSATCLEKGVLLDAFSPKREDFLS